MAKQKFDIFTGLFIIGGASLLIITLLVAIAYNAISNREMYYLRMEKLAGVKKGTPIRVKNYTVGEVGDIIPIFGTSVYFKAKVFIDRELILYRGTMVNIANQNVIGEPVVQLFPVTTGAYRLGYGDTLFATNIVNLDQMIAKVSSILDNVDKMIGSLSDISGESRYQLQMLLVNLNSSVLRVNSMLTSSEKDLLGILRNLANTTATLDRFSKDFADNPWKVLEKREEAADKSSGGGKVNLP